MTVLSPSNEWRLQFLNSRPQYDWHTEGAFHDVDGTSVRVHDDVVLLDDLVVGDGEELRQGEKRSYQIPAGTIATVLFFQSEPDGVADLECSWPADGFSFGFMPTRRLRFHMSAEDKFRSHVSKP